MKLRTYCLLAYMLVTTWCVIPHTKEPLKTALANDAEALSYCTQNANTYIVVVWPKGYAHLNYIIKKLNTYGAVKYVKQLVLNKKDMFSLFHALHPDMSYNNAKNFFKPYTKKLSHEIFPIAVLVLETNASLEKIIHFKRKIREHIGEGFYSIHINDYYPETIEAANAIFKKD